MLNAPTDDLAFAHAVRYRDAMLNAWAAREKRHGYKREDLPAYLAGDWMPNNTDRSRAEIIEFKLRPLAYGESYLAYLSSDQKTVTTFCGDVLAHITNLRPRSFWARGIDGRRYHGRHNGPGWYLRMRLAAPT